MRFLLNRISLWWLKFRTCKETGMIINQKKKSRNGKEPVNNRTGKEQENKRIHQSPQLLPRVGSSAAKWRASCRFVLTAGCISLSFHQRAHIFVGTAEVHVSLHSHYSRVHISCIPCHQLSSQQISLTPVTRTRDSCVAKLWETPRNEPRCTALPNVCAMPTANDTHFYVINEKWIASLNWKHAYG